MGGTRLALAFESAAVQFADQSSTQSSLTDPSADSGSIAGTEPKPPRLRGGCGYWTRSKVDGGLPDSVGTLAFTRIVTFLRDSTGNRILLRFEHPRSAGVRSPGAMGDCASGSPLPGPFRTSLQQSQMSKGGRRLLEWHASEAGAPSSSPPLCPQDTPTSSPRRSRQAPVPQQTRRWCLRLGQRVRQGLHQGHSRQVCGRSSRSPAPSQRRRNAAFRSTAGRPESCPCAASPMRLISHAEPSQVAGKNDSGTSGHLLSGPLSSADAQPVARISYPASFASVN